MSFQEYTWSCKIMEELPGYRCTGGKSYEEISKAEDTLLIHFSPQCREFYHEYGSVLFEGTEIFGIRDDPDNSVLEGNIVPYMLYDRKNYKMPTEWVPVYNYGDGTLAYFDYSQFNSEGEPPVIRAYHDSYHYHFVVLGTVAHDFGQLLQELVK